MNETTIRDAGDEGGDRSMAKIIYIIYFVAPALPPAALVGVIMAYANRGGDGGWVDSHYRFQIRTFWLSLLLGGVGMLIYLAIAAVALVTFVLLPLVPLVLLAVVLIVLCWWLFRAVKGYRALKHAEPHPKVTTWLW